MERYYRNIHWLFVLILITVPFGFRKYFYSFFLNSRDVFIHFHAILMIVWCVILIAQPLLIRKNNFKTHRFIGKLSFVLVPLIILSMFLMIRLSYFNGLKYLTQKQNLENLLLPFSQLFIFTLYYTLAMINKNNTAIHVRFIIISSLTLFGPTIGRFDFTNFGLNIDMVNISLLAMETIIFFLMIIDFYKIKKINIYPIAFLIFSFSHYAVFYLGNTTFWQSFAKLILT
jgi:hypothetical protein